MKLSTLMFHEYCCLLMNIGKVSQFLYSVPWFEREQIWKLFVLKNEIKFSESEFSRFVRLSSIFVYDYAIDSKPKKLGWTFPWVVCEKVFNVLVSRTDEERIRNSKYQNFLPKNLDVVLEIWRWIVCNVGAQKWSRYPIPKNSIILSCLWKCFCWPPEEFSPF